MIGFVRTDDPSTVRSALLNLQHELSNDPLFNSIPSFDKTRVAFHAKNDAPEIRAEVFKLLRTLPVRAQFVFARKRLNTFRSAFHSKEGAFYDHLVTHLFKRSLHLAQRNRIYFEKRGSRPRQEPLTAAVNKAAEAFKSMYDRAEPTDVAVQCQSPVGEPCLQAIDYFLWAVQRVFTRGEDRFFRVLEAQIDMVWDLYDTDNYPRNMYTKKNRLEIQKISPL